MAARHEKLKRWLPLIVLIALTGIWWAFGLNNLLTFDLLRARRSALLDLASSHPVIGAACFMLVYTATVALSLPAATLMTLLGGFLFGRWWGTAITVVAATTGAAILFLIARSTLGSTLKEKANPLYNKISLQMNKDAIGYLLFMRLVPIFPFFLVNIVPALFNIRFLPYVLTTFVGIIPGTFVYVNVGRQFGTLDSLSDLVSVETLISFTLLGIFALIPTLYKKLKA